MEKSLLDYGYEILSNSKTSKSFVELFNETIEAAGLKLSQSETKTKMSKFYTQLSLDARFVRLEDGSWDLQNRCKFVKVDLDAIDITSQEESSVDPEEEKLDRQELGEDVSEDEEDSSEDDDLDFDKPVKDDEDF